MRQRFLGVLVVSVGLSLSSGALAQAPKGDADTAWRAKFDAGREALRAKRVKEALALFQESWALNKTAGTMLNIGTCEEQLGQPASAWKHYKEALEMLPAKDERVPTVKQWVERVEPHVPRLRIRLDKGAPAGTKVTLGDRAVESGAMDTDVPMDPGAYTIRVSAKGFVTRTYEIKLEDGEKEVAVVTPGAPEEVEKINVAGPPAADGEKAASRFSDRTVLIVGGGALAGVGAVIGAVLTGLSFSKAGLAGDIRGTLRAGECAAGGGGAVCDKLAGAVGDQNTLGSGALWTFVGAGVVGAATGAYWYWGGRKGKTEAGNVHGGVTVHGNGAGLMVEGRW